MAKPLDFILSASKVCTHFKKSGAFKQIINIGDYVYTLKGSQEDGCIPYEILVLDGVFIKSSLRRYGKARILIFGQLI